MVGLRGEPEGHATGATHGLQTDGLGIVVAVPIEYVVEYEAVA
jgi:hypothetical protein